MHILFQKHRNCCSVGTDGSIFDLTPRFHSINNYHNQKQNSLILGFATICKLKLIFKQMRDIF